MKKFVCFIVCMLISCALAGCQTTPEADIIVNKGDDKMESMLVESEQNHTDTVIPERWSDTFVSDSKDVTVVVDASIQPMNQENIAVIRVQPHVFTINDAKSWVPVLFQGNTAYEPDALVQTRREIEAEILWRTEKINDREALLEEYQDEAAVDQFIAYYQSEIALLEEAYQTAPETVERRETDWTFHPWSYYANMLSNETDEDILEMDKTEQFQTVAAIDGQNAFFSISNRLSDDYRLHNLWFYYEASGTSTEEQTPPSSMTQDEAKAMADAQLAALGWDDWQFSDLYDTSLDEEHSAYSLMYSQSFMGQPSFWFDFSAIDLKSEDAYAANLYYGLLEVDIKNGRVDCITMLSPMDVVKVENTAAPLLSFEQVYDYFKTAAASGYTAYSLLYGSEASDDDPGLSSLNLHVSVTNIEQKLFRIKIKNNENEFRMVPAWAFYGFIGDEQESDSQCLMMINAIDSSIIHVQLGY